MRRTDSILKALDIDTDRYPVLSVVGGGGKTSLIFRIMEELTAVGKKVLITTTTHMAYEPDRPFAEDGDIISIKHNRQLYKANRTGSSAHFTPLLLPACTSFLLPRLMATCSGTLSLP